MNNDDMKTYSEVLDKMLQLETKKDKPKYFTWVISITASIASLMVVCLICFIIYKNNYSIDSLISLLLAFFSIFISVFFYFKASDTSNKFYDNSYNFMKDISVTLGKIEERFGEKLNSLNDKVSRISEVKQEKTEELETAENEKQKIISDLLEQSKLNEDEKEEYRKKLQEKENETSNLRMQIEELDTKYKRLNQRARNVYSHGSSGEQEMLERFSKIDADGLLTSNGRRFADRYKFEKSRSDNDNA